MWKPPTMLHSARSGARRVALGTGILVLLGLGGLGIADAVTPTPKPVTTTITPCRLFDTRSGADNVGPRDTPIGPAETFTATVWGTNGNCSIPAGATAVVMNVTVVDGTASSFLTVWPADKSRPSASSLNWVGGQGPTPNQVTSALSSDGKLSVYNHAGTANVIVDITAYLADHDHDDRYYTKAEVDALVSGSGASGSVVTAVTDTYSYPDNPWAGGPIAVECPTGKVATNALIKTSATSSSLAGGSAVFWQVARWEPTISGVLISQPDLIPVAPPDLTATFDLIAFCS